MKKADKVVQIEQIKERSSRMSSVVLTNFKGLDVESMTALRDRFREVGVDYNVIKNTLFNLAFDKSEFQEDLAPYLVEPTAAAWSYEDPTAAAKVVTAFRKGNDKLKIKCAILDGEVVDEAGVETLSKMPGKNELLGTLLATFQEPATGFVRLLQAAPTNFVYLMDARKRQLEE